MGYKEKIKNLSTRNSYEAYSLRQIKKTLNKSEVNKDQRKMVFNIINDSRTTPKLIKEIVEYIPKSEQYKYDNLFIADLLSEIVGTNKIDKNIFRMIMDIFPFSNKTISYEFALDVVLSEFAKEEDYIKIVSYPLNFLNYLNDVEFNLGNLILEKENCTENVLMALLKNFNQKLYPKILEHPAAGDKTRIYYKLLTNNYSDIDFNDFFSKNLITKEDMNRFLSASDNLIVPSLNLLLSSLDAPITDEEIAYEITKRIIFLIKCVSEVNGYLLKFEERKLRDDDNRFKEIIDYALSKINTEESLISILYIVYRNLKDNNNKRKEYIVEKNYYA